MEEILYISMQPIVCRVEMESGRVRRQLKVKVREEGGTNVRILPRGFKNAI